jgi:hypothetical protein
LADQKSQSDKFKEAARELGCDEYEARWDEGELAAWGIDVATITEMAVDEDSAVIFYKRDDRTWGLVIEEDREGVERIASYLSALGVQISRDGILG